MLNLFVASALARGGGPDEANHFKDVAPIGDDVTLTLVDGWARADEAKVKAIIRNDTADFLVVRTDQFMFSAHGQAMAQDEVKVIGPRSKGTKVLDFRGRDLKANGAWLVPGGIYRIASDVDPIAAPNYALPATERSFEAGPYRCVVNGKIVKETHETTLKFRCTFQGVGLGLVDISALSVIVDGAEYPTLQGNGRLRSVMPGDSFKLKATFEVPAKVADMQFAQMDVHFNDCFREGIPEALPAWEPIPLDVDWKKTH